MSPPRDEASGREPEPAAEPEREPEPGPAAEPEPEPKPEPESEPESEHRDLTRDLDEVQRGRPERAFNVGATVGIVVTVAAVIFILQNGQSTSFDWLWFDFQLPLWTALLGAIGVGIVLVLTVIAVHARRQSRIGRREQAAGRLRRALSRN